MNKLHSINVILGANDEIKFNVRFQNVNVELKGAGFFIARPIIETLYRNGNTAFKVFKKEDYILLKSKKSDSSLKGCKNLNANRASGYEYFYPYNTTATRVPTEEKYGTNFKLEMDGDDIKLYPILIDETKSIRKEILTAIMRYDQKNN